MKKYLDILLPWRKTISDLRGQVQSLTVERGVLKAQLSDERKDKREIEAAFTQTKKGVGVMLQFIHRTQRLNVPFSKDSILATLRNGNKQ